MANRDSSRFFISKVSLFCDKVMEAGWLLAALLVPLYFDIYSNRVFEPDKLSLLRSIALVMGVAWLIAFLEKWAWPGSNRAAPNPGHLSSANSWKGLLLQMAEHNVLALPTFLLIIALLVSTTASVLPAVSLWGSYVRLQGTYTALAYIVMFFIVASGLHSKAQLDRLVFVLIYTSLPISLHGVIQHLKLEFMPWLGDVTARVTSTMGNAIFIGAYLVMVIPITFATFSEKVTAFSRELHVQGGRRAGELPATRYLLPATCIISQSIALTLIVFQALQLYASLKPEGAPFGSLDQAVLALALLLLFTPFVFARRAILRQVECVLLGWILALQAATVLFSQSRGPMLGLLGGMAVYLVVLAIRRRWRRTLAALLLAGLLGTSFLVVFNLPPVRPGSPGPYRGLLGKPLLAVYNLTHGPLKPLKDAPYLGRLGNLLETEGGTGKVRLLIWEGATRLIQAEPLRTLVGYGPETMFLVYPRFYPPDLAHYEARNASPDRSHNEVMDELVTTGLLGYLAYWLVYCAVAFGALKILGLTGGLGFGRAMALAVVAGLLVAALLYAQVLPLAATPAIPLAFFALLLSYWLWPGVKAVASEVEPNPLFIVIPAEAGIRLLLVGLVAAMVAHFIEIQFGIAIAATRTYFWLFAGMVIALGAMAKDLARQPVAPPGGFSASKEAGAPPSPKAKGTLRKQPKGLPAKPAGPIVPRWLPAVTLSLVIGAVLTTMLFDFSWPGQQLPALVPWLLGTAWLTLSLGGTFTSKETDVSLPVKQT
ncbi:MAG: O-antigen ligase family protein, partial [Chloroflexota bacterium]